MWGDSRFEIGRSDKSMMGGHSGKNAEVIEPKFLRREIASEMEQCLKKYSEDIQRVERF